MRDDTGVTEDERKWGTVAHLSAFLVFVLPVGGNILGPLAVLLVMKNEGEFVESSAKEALNFQISMTIYVVLAILPALLLLPFLFQASTYLSLAILANLILACLFLLLPILLLTDLLLVVKASMEAGEKRRYEYPFSIRLV